MPGHPLDPRFLTTLETALGLAGIVIGLVTTVPQLRRILRGGSVAGVSRPALANSSISALAWTAYSCWQADLWLLGGSLTAVPGALVTTWAAWRLGWHRRDLALPAVWLAVLAAAVLAQAWVGWPVVATVVGGSIAWLVVPAVLEAWTSRDISALSAGTWWLLVLEALVALGYGVVQGLAAPVVFGLIELVGAFAVLARVLLLPPGPDPMPDPVPDPMPDPVPGQRSEARAEPAAGVVVHEARLHRDPVQIGE